MFSTSGAAQADPFVQGIVPEGGNMISVKIFRSQWYRGHGETGSALRRDDGTMCCLGFAALACGYSQGEILGQSTPAELVKGLAEGEDHNWPPGVIRSREESPKIEDSKVIMDMMTVNDQDLEKLKRDRNCPAVLQNVNTEADRERMLTELALKIGLEFEFVDGDGETP